MRNPLKPTSARAKLLAMRKLLAIAGRARDLAAEHERRAVQEIAEMRESMEPRPSESDRLHLFAFTDLEGYAPNLLGTATVRASTRATWQRMAIELSEIAARSRERERRYAEALSNVNGVRAVLGRTLRGSEDARVVELLALAVAGTEPGARPLYPLIPASAATQTERIREALGLKADNERLAP